MAHFNQKHPHENLNSFCLKESVDPDGVRRLHKYHLWYFRQHFHILDTENISYANNTMLRNSIKKSDADIANIVKKNP